MNRQKPERRSAKTAASRSTVFLTVALPKGKLYQGAVALFAGMGLAAEEMREPDPRKLVFENASAGMRFAVIRPADVPTYVEYGAADLGIVGSDVLYEQERDVYEPIDLKFGRCRLMVAEPEALSRVDNPGRWSGVRIATKFPNLTESFFARRGIPVEIVKLYGSMELAPILGLSERIVDLVDTGRTLKANGLAPVETIMESTARLIVNRAALKIKYDRVSKLMDDIRGQIGRPGEGR
ncbi:MAG: ATP phosphoribosyltransferase [Nitrospirota bacterium]